MGSLFPAKSDVFNDHMKLCRLHALSVFIEASMQVMMQDDEDVTRCSCFCSFWRSGVGQLQYWKL